MDGLRAALALEMYLAGARDGGARVSRLCHRRAAGQGDSGAEGRGSPCSDRPPEKLAWLREHYRPGARVKLLRMNDPYRPDLKAGALGTVIAVDDIGTIHVAWDGGRFAGAWPTAWTSARWWIWKEEKPLTERMERKLLDLKARQQMGGAHALPALRRGPHEGAGTTPTP